MGFSTDSDVMIFQPYVFGLGVDSFAEYHDLAGDDIAGDLLVHWVPLQGVVDDEEFSQSNLYVEQWVLCSVFRVLGWYVLPRLAASAGGQGLLDMMRHYRTEYETEFRRQLGLGVRYRVSGVFVTVALAALGGAAERARLQR